MGKVLITASHFQSLCADALNLLKENGHEVILGDSDIPYFSFEQLKQWAPVIDAAIIGMDLWDEKVFGIAPKLKVLARFGVGTDNIDLQAAKKHGVKVVNARGMNSNAVAELAAALILNALRNIPDLNRRLSGGEWARRVGHELKGKTVGLLGFGDIGGKVAKKLSGFEARLLAYDPLPDFAKAEKLGVLMTDLDTILLQSDILSIHMPSIPSTYHIVNAELIAKMKRGAYLVNTARGVLVDTEALCRAVKEGVLRGAALDVYEKEPLPPDDPVLHTEGILCTPHTGAETAETYKAISMMTAQAVIDVLNGGNPQNWLNR
ncbi:phosphoglycerate dehydrogenase [Caproiciproducens sp. NJN-50]|uniref:phosphoglycerate dehydrogenase n=1 Tax=Caproiciproducens sp. NJN-50 TaxID=2507162 RepID=UPI000FFE2FC0|nr:phosphoglycerate dehydrogenase [Caproiciproducens sp. NJN-50]QAT50042.1 phosphoglycerate dehydrogenase [Caproiciproducens sp. NJN-50]